MRNPLHASHRRGARPGVRLVACALALGLAGAAAAQPKPLAQSALPLDIAPLDVAAPATRFDAAQALKAAGIARTSLDRRFDRRQAVASVGFLCGLQPDPDTRGAAGAFGDDPHGRFLGAQLRFGFR